MAHAFKVIAAVPTPDALLDAVLSGTQRRTPAVVCTGWQISRVRAFYLRKVKFTAQAFVERLDSIAAGFPDVDELHPFLADLVNVLFARDHYALALRRVRSCRSTIDSLGKDYSRLLKFGDSRQRCRALRRACIGRMATAVVALHATLTYLEQVRQHLARLPAVDPSGRTLILAGFPNVGKSSFHNRVSGATVDVQPYAFTTKSLYVGHFGHGNLRYQTVDTPGMLDRPLEEMGTIELQAVAALAHLQSCVLYFVDVSEECGYTIKQQVALFRSIRPLFQDRPALLVANKVDLRGLEQLNADDRELVEAAAREPNTQLVEMSNVSEAGVDHVKAEACRALLEFRAARKVQAPSADASIPSPVRPAETPERLVIEDETKYDVAPTAADDGDTPFTDDVEARLDALEAAEAEPNPQSQTGHGGGDVAELEDQLAQMDIEDSAS